MIQPPLLRLRRERPDEDAPGGAAPGEAAPETRDEPEEAPERWLRCAACGAPLARPADAISVSPHPHLASFVNPAGYVHEVLTFREAPGAVWAGPRVPADSWFPGYTWRYGVCAVCHGFVGWFYETVHGRSPPTFWGLRRPALREG